MREQDRLRSQQARKEAGELLKVGDRITFTRCGGLIETRRFTRWDGHWAVCAPRLRDHMRSLWRYRELGFELDDVSAVHIRRVNGRPVQFGNGDPFGVMVGGARGSLLRRFAICAVIAFTGGFIVYGVVLAVLRGVSLL